MSGPGSLARIRTCGNSLADAMSSMMATVEIKNVRLAGSEPGRRVENRHALVRWFRSSADLGTSIDVTSTSGVF